MSSTLPPNLNGARLASLLRYSSGPQAAAIGDACAEVLLSCDDERRGAIQRDAAALLAGTANGGTAARPAAEERGPATETLRQKAALELKLETQGNQLREREAELQKLQTELREANETLGLQQRKIRELTEERSRLLADIGQLDAKLRLQINETEQALLQYEKLKGSRQLAGQAALEQTEALNAARAEADLLRAELEQTRQAADSAVGAARQQADVARSGTADAVFRELWGALSTEMAEIFVPSHVPTRETYANLGETTIELIRMAATLEMHVQHLLRDLRQVSEQSDKLNRFYITFTKSARLAETIREYLVTGRKKANFVNLVRSHLAWARAFATGLNKVIIRSPNLIADELNYRQWPLQKGWGTEEAAIGKYFKETAMKTIPEKIGTDFRKVAGDMAYEDYNELIRQR